MYHFGAFYLQMSMQMKSKKYNNEVMKLDMFINIVHFKKTQKKFFMNNFCVPELDTLKFLTQKETMVTQICFTNISKFSF